MDRSSAMRLLPALYAAAIVLDDEGCDDQRIATRLGIEASTVAAVIAMGRAKLAALEAVPALGSVDENR